MTDGAQPKSNSSFSWVSKLKKPFSNAPQSLDEIIELLKSAYKEKIISIETLNMLEGAIEVSNMQVSNIMIPRSQMVVVDSNEKLNIIMKTVTKSGHSRLPVADPENDEIIGIIHSKELLKYRSEREQAAFDIRKIMRKVTFVPESKRLDTLLKEFKASRNHMAIVIDEYGNISGLVTIEDVLEEIVGNIEDEFDIEEEYIKKLDDHSYLINALTTIEQFNEYFDAELIESDAIETIGGLVTQQMEYVPKKGEKTQFNGTYQIEVIEADKRRIRWLKLTLLDESTDSET